MELFWEDEPRRSRENAFDYFDNYVSFHLELHTVQMYGECGTSDSRFNSEIETTGREASVFWIFL